MDKSQVIHSFLQDASIVESFTDLVLKHHLNLKFYDYKKGRIILSALLNYEGCTWEFNSEALKRQFEALNRISSHYIFQDCKEDNLNKNYDELRLYCFHREEAKTKWELKRAEEKIYQKKNITQWDFTGEDGTSYKGKYEIDYRSPRENPFYQRYFKEQTKKEMEEKEKQLQRIKFAVGFKGENLMNNKEVVNY